MGLIAGTTDYADLADADIVIEAAFEDMNLKKKIFATLDETCKPDAILASNTSSLDIDEIATATGRPDKVVGMHFFSPANVMRLVENVRTAKASRESLATLMQLSKGLGKTGVMVGVGDGFVGNRMYHVAARIGEFLVEEGAMPWDVDEALYDWGFAMGPFAVNDLAGIDIRIAIREGQKSLYPGRREPVIVQKLYEMGRYGQKTGKGWYDYSEGRRGKPDPEVEALIIEASKELGIERREFSRSDIIQAYLVALANTGARVLDEGLAIRSGDIDVIWNYGYGFPRRRGGPMFHADLVGLDEVLAKAGRTARGLWRLGETGGAADELRRRRQEVQRLQGGVGPQAQAARCRVPPPPHPAPAKLSYRFAKPPQPSPPKGGRGSKSPLSPFFRGRGSG